MTVATPRYTSGRNIANGIASESTAMNSGDARPLAPAENRQRNVDTGLADRRMSHIQELLRELR
jgi:hypothetical protein